MNGNRMQQPVLGSSESKTVLISEVKRDNPMKIVASLLAATLIAIILTGRKK